MQGHAVLRNDIHAPSLPYNFRTCIRLCQSKISLDECNCTYEEEARNYMNHQYAFCREAKSFDAKKINGLPCMKHRALTLNIVPFDACRCFPKCVEYQFVIVGYQISQYQIGKLNNLVVLRSFNSAGRL